MPTRSSFASVCPLPIGFDTYHGCTHGCTYCYHAEVNQEMAAPVVDEGPEELRAFIAGHRSVELAQYNWRIPIRLGRASDPFQPCEAQHRRTLAVLEVLADTGYPFVFTTKGRLAAAPEYLTILKRCNAVVQVSMVSPLMDVDEPGAPSYDERLMMVYLLARVCRRVIVRAQPLYLDDEHLAAFASSLPDLKLVGAHGVLVETLSSGRDRDSRPGMTREGLGFWHYPPKEIASVCNVLKDMAHDAGLRFFSGDACIREMGAALVGDHPTCCGCGDLPGFSSERSP